MAPRDRKKRELAQRKNFIIDESKKLFFNKGFENVSIQDICNAIEYGRSAVYALFESKEEIYGHIFVEAMKIMADLLLDIDAEETGPDEIFVAATEKVYQFYTRFRPYYTALFFFDFNKSAHDRIPDYLMKRKYEEKERGTAVIRGIISHGIEEGLFRPFPVEEIIDLYMASLQGILNARLIDKRDGKDDPELKNVLISHAEIYSRGLYA